MDTGIQKLTAPDGAYERKISMEVTIALGMELFDPNDLHQFHRGYRRCHREGSLPMKREDFNQF